MAVETLKRWKKGSQKSYFFLNGRPFTLPPFNGPAIKRRTFFLRLPQFSNKIIDWDVPPLFYLFECGSDAVLQRGEQSDPKETSHEKKVFLQLYHLHHPAIKRRTFLRLPLFTNKIIDCNVASKATQKKLHSLSLQVDIFI